jgi:hypothetical protein
LLSFAPGVKENVVTAMRTAQRTLLFIKTDRSLLYRKIINVCSEVHTKHENEICEQNVSFLMLRLAMYKLTTGY